VTQDRLFAGDSLHDRLQAELAAAIRAVEARGPDWLLERSVDEAAAEALAAYQVPPLEIAWERRWSPGVRETTVDMQHNIMYGGAGQGRPVHVPAADQVFVHVPFTGERDLLFCRPSTFSLSSPRAKVTADELILEITQTNLSGEQIAAAFDSFRSQVESSAATANADVAAHNEQLAAVLRGRVETRRRRLLAQRELTASLPFDIRPTGVQPTFAVPAKRKRVHLTQPRPSKPFEPQPELMNATYEDILERIVAAAQQLERAPETFEGMGEEDLRNLLLVSLNMAYEGQAGAELFSRAGKTDIAVTVGDRKVFIAEARCGAASASSAPRWTSFWATWCGGTAKRRSCCSSRVDNQRTSSRRLTQPSPHTRSAHNGAALRSLGGASTISCGPLRTSSGSSTPHCCRSSSSAVVPRRPRTLREHGRRRPQE
jgi:hypothetical protein